jgi:hypothetical protein
VIEPLTATSPTSVPALQSSQPKWDVDRAVQYLTTHASNVSLGLCAEYTRRAIEAGGVKLKRHIAAKDYGSSLTAIGFQSLGQLSGGYQRGDVAIIQPIKGHPYGHMTMLNGVIWISDFRQKHGLYPGATYRKIKPPYTIYRYPDAGPSISPAAAGFH